MKAILSAGEMDLLEFLQDQKFMTLEQMEKRLFGGVLEDRKNRSLYYRMRHLVRCGYLREWSDEVNESLYLLGSRGLEVLRGKDRDGGMPLLADIESELVLHDLAVTDCRILWERIGLVKQWISDRRMQFCLPNPRHIPDAIFLVRGQMVALEVEFSLKSKERYEGINSFYDSREAVKLALYVVKDEKLLSSLKRNLTSPKLFFCLFRDLMDLGEKAGFASCQEQFRVQELMGAAA